MKTIAWTHTAARGLAALLSMGLLCSAGCMTQDPWMSPVRPGETAYLDIQDVPRETDTSDGLAGIAATIGPSAAGDSTQKADTTGMHDTFGTSSAGTQTITTQKNTVSHATAAVSSTTTPAASTTGKAPSTEKEFRGVWVSYIELNKLLGGKTAAQAKQVLDTLMNTCVNDHLNAVIFHVRANSDAYYASKLFPLAAAVKPLLNAGFDPLAYAVQAAHARGLELHAWVNPYRVGPLLSNKRCDDVFQVKDRYYYAPHSETVKKLVLDGVRELLRYDIDGVQYDDYFYPFVSANAPEEFEKTAYAAYQKQAGAAAMSLGDWRRNHVNTLIAGTYAAVHTKAGCVFGVSPSHDYQQTYAKLYADPKKWMAERGYVDYMCPQIYFGFEHGSAAFDTMTERWLSYPRLSSVKLYVGLALYKTGLSVDQYAGTGKGEWAEHSDIMKRSVQFLRTQSACGGLMLYSYTFLNPLTQREGAYSTTVAKKEVDNLLAVL